MIQLIFLLYMRKGMKTTFLHLYFHFMNVFALHPEKNLLQIPFLNVS